MSKIKPGDIVGCERYGDYSYYTVLRVEKDKLICVDMYEDYEDYEDDEDDDYAIRLSASQVDHYPAVTVGADKVRELLRYEASFEELFGDIYPYARITCDEKIMMSGEDLLSALRRCKEKGFENAEEEWMEPVRSLLGKLFDFSNNVSSNEPVDGYRFIPQAGQLFFHIFAAAVLPWYRETDEPDFEKLISKTEKTIKMLELPVPEREYDDEIKEDYIRKFDNDDMRAVATDDEMALFVQYVDELCEKDNKTALYAKAYSLYGGNRAYDCDWRGSRDLLLRLMKIDENPFLANTLGYIFYYGRCTGGAPEYDKAFYYYNIGAAGGVYESRYKLADMYFHGYGVNKNISIAARIVRELYDENLKYIQEGHTDCKFADIAFRMGNFVRGGVNEDADPDGAYYYYLQADFAIRQRMRDHDHYGDQSVAAGIGKSIDEILPQTSFVKPCYTLHTEYIRGLLSSAFDLHRRVEAKIKKLTSGQYSVRFRILPMQGEEYPPRFFVTVPEAHFCGYMDHITVNTEDLFDLRINGKKFNGDNAVVIFDNIDYEEFTLYGECVMELITEYVFKLQGKKSGKQYRFVSVTFDEGSRHYDYLCDIPDVRVGDKVVVLSGDEEYQVNVVGVFEKNESETKLPLAKYKSVLRKA